MSTQNVSTIFAAYYRKNIKNNEINSFIFNIRFILCDIYVSLPYLLIKPTMIMFISKNSGRLMLTAVEFALMFYPKVFA